MKFWNNMMASSNLDDLFL